MPGQHDGSCSWHPTHPPHVPSLPALGLFQPIITRSAQLHSSQEGDWQQKKFLEGESAQHILFLPPQEELREHAQLNLADTILPSKSFSNFPTYNSPVAAQDAGIEYKSFPVASMIYLVSQFRPTPPYAPALSPKMPLDGSRSYLSPEHSTLFSPAAD